MAGGVARYGRAIAGALLAAGVVAVCVCAHLGWVRAAEDRFGERAAQRQAAGEAAAARSEADEAAQRRRAKDRYQATKTKKTKKRPSRTGTTTITVSSNGMEVERGGVWTVEATHRLTLRSGDPMVADLRGGTQKLAHWLPFTMSDYSGIDDCAIEPLKQDDYENNRVDQSGSVVRVAASSDWRGAQSFTSCSIDPSPLARLTLKLKADGALLGKGGLYDSWKVVVRTKGYRIVALDGGRVVKQASGSAEFTLNETGEAGIYLDQADGVGREVGDVKVLSSALQDSHAPLRERILLAVAVIALAVCLVVPFLGRWAPAAAGQRWERTGLGAAAVTGLLLAGTLDDSGETRLRGTALVVWGWVVLPLLVAAWAVRAGTGRPPRAGRLALLVLPGVAVFAPAAVLLAQGRSGPVLLVQGGAAVGAAGVVALLLRAGVLGPLGRRWAATATAVTAVAVAAAGPGTGLPLGDEAVYGIDTGTAWASANSLAVWGLCWFWPAALLVTLRALGVPRPPATLAAAGAWWLLATDGNDLYSWGRTENGAWYDVGIGGSTAANHPLVVVQTLVVCLALLTLLRRGGPAAGPWPPYARPAVLALGVAAVGTALTEQGFATFVYDIHQDSGLFLALAVAAVGFAWLIPPSGQSEALRLHSATSAEHTRDVHRLLKNQTLAAGRRAFLGGAHTALADGTLTARQWSTRWRELGGRTEGGKSPQQRWQQVRADALGSSGGRTARRNGIAAATLLAVLSLPWTVYTLPSKVVSIDSGEVAEAVAVWSTALRWPLYGFVYGYLYSWLRGRTPLGKAMCLLAVVLPAELASLLYQGTEPAEFGIKLLLTSGDCLAVFLVLGLYWEARQVRAAGLRWGQIRNFRSLSTLAVPATTVVVAAATALATALVGFWAVPDQPAEQAPPAVTGSPTPGPSGH
ncbi:hypothetical protein AB0J38_12750 [Streptomyces sp. NPDC050095]|uniref:hypothetical protein n=1 Tax=unclassified Streptomyces TaxID=2593676 RepID=UPI003449E368